MGTSSGTSALHLALLACGIREGDEVITVPNTFIATTEAISHCGAKIKFADIDINTHNIDVSKIEKAITEGTRVIIPVHLYGQPADMDPILEIAKRYNHKEGDFPVSEGCAREILSLPMFPELKGDEIKELSKLIQEYKGSNS